jgi:tetratricopeptide (TPR) repeat protein
MLDEKTKKSQAEIWLDEAERHWSESDKSEKAAKDTLNFIENAIQLNPLNHRAWADKGFILKQLGNLESALMCLDRALTIDQGYVNPLYNKGVLLGLMGRFEEAMKCYEQVLSKEPKHQLAQRDMNVLLQIIRKKKA